MGILDSSESMQEVEGSVSVGHVCLSVRMHADIGISMYIKIIPTQCKFVSSVRHILKDCVKL